MRGRIIKGIAGFYSVDVAESGIYECKARGIFRNKGCKPLVGDEVEIDILGQDPPEGNILSILPRKNELIRPAVANIDLSLACMAFTIPKPSMELLDVFLLLMEEGGVPAGICFNKDDLAKPYAQQEVRDRFSAAGYPIFFVSTKTGEGVEELREVLHGKTTVLSGPSGVGKSSLTNLLLQERHMETGSLSDKTLRGKNTTRHVELLSLGEGTFLMDTPGFTSLDLERLNPETLKEDFPEFREYAPLCRFRECRHDREPDCAVKAAVSEGKIPRARYESYANLYHLVKEKKKR